MLVSVHFHFFCKHCHVKIHIVVKCMKTDACHQQCVQRTAQKEELLDMDLLTGNSGVTTVRLGQFI